MKLRCIIYGKVVLWLFVLSYAIGCIITPLIGFGYLDELCVFSLLAYYCIQLYQNKTKRCRLFYYFCLLWGVYGLLSFLLDLIETKVIFIDMIQLSKPFLTFICVYELEPILISKNKKKLNRLSLVMACIYVLSYLFLPHNGVHLVFAHSSVYGKLMLLSALVFLYTSNKTKEDIIVFFAMVLMSTFCLKSRAFVEAVLAFVSIAFVSKRIKMNLKYVTLGLVTCLIMAYVAWSKIDVYFGDAKTDTSSARSVLYETGFSIAKDFFPIGTGFGSFANDASRYIYSPVYDMYGISGVWGLSRVKDDFIADTFFPCIIGQFGFIGLFFFVYFFYFMHKKTKCDMSNRKKRIDYCVAIIIIGTLVLESVAGPTLVTAVGIPYVILINFIISDMKYMNT